jgi:hypothetical protein
VHTSEIDRALGKGALQPYTVSPRLEDKGDIVDAENCGSLCWKAVTTNRHDQFEWRVQPRASNVGVKEMPPERRSGKLKD